MEKGPPSSEDGDQTFAIVVQGAPRGSYWTSHRLSLEDIKQLQARFTKVLELSTSIVDAARCQWDKLAVVVKSLGWQVPVEWISKEVWSKLNLDYDPEMFLLAENHIVVCLQSKKDWSLVKSDGPWFMGGQLQAMEEWFPDFVP